MEMRMAVSRVALRHRRLGLAVPEDVVRFDEGAMDTFTMSLPPLPLVFHSKVGRWVCGWVGRSSWGLRVRGRKGDGFSRPAARGRKESV